MIAVNFVDYFMRDLFENADFYGDVLYGLFVMSLSVLSYVLGSYGLYTMARSRRIRRPWLAWFPVGNSWILGSISDQYHYVHKGQNKNKRKVLLVLELLTCAAVVGMLAALIVPLVQNMMQSGDVSLEHLIVWLMGVIGLSYLLLLGLSVATLVIRYIALFDLYRSCDPANSEVFLILSIFLSFLQPILIFISRNKEKGMPPRKDAPFTE